MFLLDTNVVSEPKRARPDMRVVAWLGEQLPSDLHISVLTVGDHRRGVEDHVDAQRLPRHVPAMPVMVARLCEGGLEDVGHGGEEVRWHQASPSSGTGAAGGSKVPSS